MRQAQKPDYAELHTNEGGPVRHKSLLYVVHYPYMIVKPVGGAGGWIVMLFRGFGDLGRRITKGQDSLLEKEAGKFKYEKGQQSIIFYPKN